MIQQQFPEHVHELYKVACFLQKRKIHMTLLNG